MNKMLLIGRWKLLTVFLPNQTIGDSVMVSRVQLMKQKGLISPPKWLPANIHYEVITGSVSYSVSSDTSDMDIVGFCIPRRKMYSLIFAVKSPVLAVRSSASVTGNSIMLWTKKLGKSMTSVSILS